ncbi:MAG: DUF2157 domain-containing protein [Flavobacteriales bacterium]|nr:DUF2157 domain-containing protein [Flavobacteriales bacterium]
MHGPHLLDELPRLVAAGLITPDQADRIRAHYDAAQPASAPVAIPPPPAAAPTAHSPVHGSRLTAVFGILGSLLIGLGIVLLVAHNWDELSRGTRTVLCFLPVLAGQALVFWGLRKHPGSIVWSEAPAIFLATSVAACVALIAQIYHVGGTLEGYLLTVSLLILGLCYVPGSAVVAITYLAAISWYGVLLRVSSGDSLPYLWLPLFAVVVPAVVQRMHDATRPVAAGWSALLAGLALGIGANLFYRDFHPVLVLGAAALGSAYACVPWLTDRDPGAGHKAIARLGALALLILLYYFGSNMLLVEAVRMNDTPFARDAGPFTLLILLGVAAYALTLRRRKPFSGTPYPEGFFILAVLYSLAHLSTVLAAVFANVLLLVVGVWHVREGSRSGSLRRMNFGLLLIALTISWRFFEVDVSYVVRGLVFIGIGASFLLLNLRMLRARKPDIHA